MELNSLPDDIQSFLKPGKIFMVSGTYCPYCTMAKKMLDDWGCNYEYIECDVSPITHQQRQQIQTLSGIKTIPNIFIGNKSIGGCSDLSKLKKDGELKNILKEQDVVCSKL